MARQRPQSSDVGNKTSLLVTAIEQATTALATIPAAVTPFVAAFNPGALDLLLATFERLAATIGYALEPILQATTQVVSNLASALASVAVALRPILTDLAGTFVNVLAPIVSVIADQAMAYVSILRALTPVLQLLLTVVEGVASIFSTLVTIVSTVISTLLGVVSLDGAIASVRDAFVTLAGAIIQATDFLLRLVGQGDLANRVLEALARRRGQDTIAAAPRQIGVTGLQDIYRQRLEASARGTTGQDLQVQTNSILERIRQVAEQQLEEARRTGGPLAGMQQRLRELDERLANTWVGQFGARVWSLVGG